MLFLKSSNEKKKIFFYSTEYQKLGTNFLRLNSLIVLWETFAIIKYSQLSQIYTTVVNKK